MIIFLARDEYFGAMQESRSLLSLHATGESELSAAIDTPEVLNRWPPPYDGGRCSSS